MAITQAVTYEDLVHVGPGMLAGRYLRLFWQPVYRAKDLPPGRAVPLTVLGEPFTLYRGATGQPHLVDFRCAHRGTQLSVGWVEDDCIRCRYHGWMYDASGQCVEQPGEDATFAQRVRIRAYPAQEYAGLVFVYLGESDPPPFRRFADLELPGVIVVDPPEVLPCNFWNRFDNDNAHLAWTHRSTALRTGQPEYLLQRTEVFEETPYGYVSRSDANGRAGRSTHFYMPNVLHFHPRVRAKGYLGQDIFEDKFAFFIPIDDEHFVAYDVTRTPVSGETAEAYAAQRQEEQEDMQESRWEMAKAILAGKMTIEEIPDGTSAYVMNSIDDYVTQVGQGAIADRTTEHLVRTDARVIFKRNLWLRELAALAEGRPLKQWKVPDSPIYD